MCLSPISIINPSKYVSLKYKDQYLLQVPCGKCAECQTQNSSSWMFRTYYEFLDCINSGGFVLFDTLTYSDKYLPRLSDRLLGIKSDYSCFNHDHITHFMKRLRITLNRECKGVRLRYFLSSEYGTSESHTHRPHYHVLFFVYGKIDPIVISQYISVAWYYGRTDGWPYRSASHIIDRNVIKETSLASVLRTANYVTKYVQKSCVFQKELDKRVNSLMLMYAEKFSPDDTDKWLKSLSAYRIRKIIKSLVNQFHRQSLHFGESALSEMDIKEIFDKGCLIMPHFKGVKIPIALPTYYKRKLFYRLVEIDGSKSWQLNDLGVEYKNARSSKLLSDLESRLQCVCIQHRLDYDCKELADYIYNKRGRIKGDLSPCCIEEKLQNLDLFNYVTVYDKDQFGCRGLTSQYLGNSTSGYQLEIMPAHYTIKDFIMKHVYMDEEKEKQLSTIYYYIAFIDKGKQDSYELKQRLTNLYKLFV